MGFRDSFLVASASIRTDVRTDVFSAMPSKPVAKKPIPGKPQAIKPAQKKVAQKKPAPDILKDLRLFSSAGCCKFTIMRMGISTTRKHGQSVRS